MKQQNRSAERSVSERYSNAAQKVEPALCCAVQYDAKYLEVIPPEIMERDYGCGNPTPFVRPGESVLDLGSGGGKACYIAAQIVGPTGRVTGVDCNLDMLALSRRYVDYVSERLGYSNVDFRCGLIQDLRLDLDRLAVELDQHPVCDQRGWLHLRDLEDRLRREHPMIPDDSMDCILSNCVLNLVRRSDRDQLFSELFRVLRPGGRAAISDIVASEDVPDALQSDHELWSGCISGAFREDRFVRAFQAAGFGEVRIVQRQEQPWQTITGIEFRAVTVLAHKGSNSMPVLQPIQACCNSAGPCC